MENAPAKDVKRANRATVTVIVPVVRKNAAALNKMGLLLHQAPLSWGFLFVKKMIGSLIKHEYEKK